MKIYSLDCGEPNEYFGLENRPKNCRSCNSEFYSGPKEENPGKETEASENVLNDEKFIIGGFDFSNLSSLIEISVEGETPRKASRKRSRQTKK
jgi:hypothetical protein